MKKPSELIYGYFPNLTNLQKQQFDALDDCYRDWNSQINVISRKDIDSLYLRHVLHSLAIAKYIEFKAGERVLDVGTGGGFPGIPLAILFPETEFVLVDSIGKKIKVVNEVANSIGLKNVKGIHARAESIEGKFNFIVSRAVTQLKDFYPWVRNKVKKDSINAVPNGILYLKGGDLAQEIKESGLKPELIPISAYFSEDFFETKYILHIPIT
ncbi:16S rRNA (guanine(527)-N(7))-methyltransferase RsmG [Albibacterium bauzanense]|uniref:Ribosomal RNA small subunit methyltransferase G n=1 Tax=Albibacterium bauzanense TaxID=653929 RepID=A0A4R1M427_9SPHI|nr:16S rRNA (guanine(527)-N(7))-methyltransferase RsmG [Albibacterium bauzanense]TCK85634.1 16S rRNA m(7)G-527 methyltransferase [Albibacterium bauzanense]